MVELRAQWRRAASVSQRQERRRVADQPEEGPCEVPFKIKDTDGNEVELLTQQEQTDMITKAVKAHTKKLGEDLSKSVGETVGASLAETLSAFEGRVTGFVEEKTKAAPKTGEGGDDIANHPVVKGMQKQLAESQQKIKDAETAAQLERAKAKDSALRTTLQERLVKAGIDPKRAHLALGTLIDAQKRVRYGDDDALVFKGDDNEEVDLETGLKSWLQTDDAKTFMPPRGASGSGDRPGGKAPGQGQSGPNSVAALGRAVLSAIPGMPAARE